MSCTASNIPADKHLFFDRRGGFSTGKYHSLNFSLNSLDNRENIFKNIAIVANHFNQSEKNLNIMIQGVSNKAVYIEKPSQFQIEADGAVTDKANIILAIRTADCAPVLFYDGKHKVIGVSHAGWRGALYGIIENTLSLMLSYGAEKKTIAAAVGPCLQKTSFECQQDMIEKFLNINPNYQIFFTPQDERHWLFDAQAFCVHKLKTCGVDNIWTSNINTYTDDNYFSYRRNCHQKSVSQPKDFPSHLSTIML